jgi:hypothetical protein
MYPPFLSYPRISLMSRSWPAILVFCTLISLCAHAVEPLLSIDTPILKLLADPRTKLLIEKHLPALAKRLGEEDQDADLIGNSSPRELSADAHLRGITEEKLKGVAGRPACSAEALDAGQARQRLRQKQQILVVLAEVR